MHSSSAQKDPAQATEPSTSGPWGDNTYHLNTRLWSKPFPPTQSQSSKWPEPAPNWQRVKNTRGQLYYLFTSVTGSQVDDTLGKFWCLEEYSLELWENCSIWLPLQDSVGVGIFFVLIFYWLSVSLVITWSASVSWSILLSTLPDRDTSHKPSVLSVLSLSTHLGLGRSPCGSRG